MERVIKTWALAFALIAVLLGMAHSTPITLKRGLNLDIWDVWPGEDQWGDRGVLLPFPEWRRKLTSNDFAALKNAGFDFVRIPIDPAPFLSSRTASFRDELYTSALGAVRTATDANLNVVVDLHAIPAGDRTSGSDRLADDNVMFDRYVAFVRRMARTLAREDPDRVALELMNEPLAGCDGNAAKWAKMQKRLFAAARSSATRVTLILSGGCWGGAESLAEIDPDSFPDDNVLWTFHSYAPFILTHQGAFWAGDFIRYVTGIPYPPFGSNTDETDAALANIRKRIRSEAPIVRRSGMLAYLDELMAEIDTREKLSSVMKEPFEIAARWADKNGIDRGNILLGEFGMIRQEYGTAEIMDPRWRARYLADMTDLAETYGFSWSIWGYGGAFGIVEEFEGRRAEPDVLEMVGKLP